MKIIVAKTAGFCMGVKRAVDLALENGGKVPGGLKTIGPLIHNHQTIDMLRQHNVVELDKIDTADASSTLLIRAHGIPPETERGFADRGHAIIDGTCPKVKTVHKVIARYRSQGYRIVIAGDEGHAEVVGLLGYAGPEALLIHTPDDVATLPEAAKVCLVSQTTFDRVAFDAMAEKFKERYKHSEAVVKKTICAATEQRQAETEALARQVEALVVVGGKDSANTKRLAKIATNAGTPTQLVETEEDIDWRAIAHCKIVGVTAGASTPNWMIKRIVDFLQFMDQTHQRTAANLARQFLDSAANLNIFVSLGAVAIFYASCGLQGYAFTAGGGALAFLYFLSMYLWNSVTSIESTQHLGISRYRFYHTYKYLLFAIAAGSIIALLAVSFVLGKPLFWLMLFASASGSAYHATIVPKSLRRIIPYERLKDIPTSRDLFVALAWGTVLTFIPQALHGRFTPNLLTFACFGWVFVLAFLRSLIFDLRDIEGDRILGRETLITIVGEMRARRAMYMIIWLCIGLLVVVPWAIGLETDRSRSIVRFLSQIPALLYAAVFVRWNPRLKSTMPAVFNIMADGLFYLAGVGIFFASLAIG
jgi:(E)-4-hydroxy-3-methyl-but-2-enyl pyrophosphate reductase